MFEAKVVLGAWAKVGSRRVVFGFEGVDEGRG